MAHARLVRGISSLSCGGLLGLNFPRVIRAHIPPTAFSLRCLLIQRPYSMANLPQTFKAIQIHEHGGPEVVKLNDVTMPKPGSNIILKVEWSGVNYIDNYQRSGLYPNKAGWPLTLGTEAAGTIVALPDTPPKNDSDYDARKYHVGQKVAVYGGGAYAEYMIAPWQKIFPIPDGIDTRLAAATLTQALTVLTQVKESYEAKRGDTILVHAAAGGLGLVYCQVLSALGCQVIGTVSTKEKAELAKKNGAAHTLLYAGPEKADLEAEILRLTDGKGVHAIYDGVGKDTWELDFKVIRRLGTIVFVGNASGPVPLFPVLKLAEKNVRICRPTLGNSLVEPSEAVAYTDTMWRMLKEGTLSITIFKEYPFSVEGLNQANSDQSGRGTTGKLLVKVA
ncbi:NAD(P)-binding protein [Auriculariales sp. MPI-PUGE-AT-0066]|nr:NAD(P)-binding protein [Auriculariales sp. MPI-PUGE-AT-0066]